MAFEDLIKDTASDTDLYLKKIITQLRKQFVKGVSTGSEPTNADASVVKDIKWTTMKCKDLPRWLQLNEYLHQGHRPPLPSYWACLKSWYRIHTETVNIWSHLLSFFVFLLIFVHNWFFSDYELREKLALSPFVMGFIACFGFSTAYHTVNCHSESVSLAAVTCDYSGIICCMVGSMYSVMVYMWWCRWHWTVAYCILYTSISIFFYYLTLVTFSVQSYSKKKRTIVVIVAGFSAFLPLVHEISAVGVSYVLEEYPLMDVFVALITCLVSAAIYSTRMPESIWPGKFDIWFHSHQLFHVMVAMVALVGYHRLTLFAESRYSATNRTTCTSHESTKILE